MLLCGAGRERHPRSVAGLRAQNEHQPSCCPVAHHGGGRWRVGGRGSGFGALFSHQSVFWDQQLGQGYFCVRNHCFLGAAWRPPGRLWRSWLLLGTVILAISTEAWAERAGSESAVLHRGCRELGGLELSPGIQSTCECFSKNCTCPCIFFYSY